MKRLIWIAFATSVVFGACKKGDQKADPNAEKGVPKVAEVAKADGTNATGTAAPAGGAAAPADPAGGAAAPADPATAPTGPVPTEAEVDAMGTRLFKMFEALADGVAANATDCAAMAKVLGQVRVDHADFLVEAKKWKVNEPASAKMQAWMDSHGGMERTAKMAEKVKPGLSKCATDPSVKAVMDSLDM